MAEGFLKFKPKSAEEDTIEHYVAETICNMEGWSKLETIANNKTSSLRNYLRAFGNSFLLFIKANLFDPVFFCKELCVAAFISSGFCKLFKEVNLIKCKPRRQQIKKE